MKKLLIALSMVVAFGTAAMAQQPAQNEANEQHACCKNHQTLKQADKPCCNEAKATCAMNEQHQQACCKEGQNQQKDCCKQSQPQHGDCCKEGHHHHFHPHGKAIVCMFEHLGATSTNNGWEQGGFQMERAYLGYQYQFDPAWSATVILDAAQGNNVSIDRVFIKNAFVKYSKNGLTVSAGIIPTVQGTMAENCWGYRYVARSMYDLYGYGNTADLGFNVKYDFCDVFSADFSMLNGEGFRKIQLDNDYLYGLGLTLRPVKGLSIRVYGDLQTQEHDSIMTADTTAYTTARKNLQVFAGYDHKYFRIGAEYNFQFASDYYAGHTATGYSIYATGKVTPKLNIFGRYDNGASKNNSILADTWSYGNNGQNVYFGVDYNVNKVVSLAPAIQYHITPDNSTSLYAYLSAKIAF